MNSKKLMIKLLCPNKKKFSKEIEKFLPKYINCYFKELSQKQFDKVFLNMI